MARLIGISDIHGEYQKLCSVLNKIAPKKEDTIIFMGDYIDRGDKSNMHFYMHNPTNITIIFSGITAESKPQKVTEDLKIFSKPMGLFSKVLNITI